MALSWFELEGFLDCGLLCRGFAHLVCSACKARRLVALLL
jgi:hypothetical protein